MNTSSRFRLSVASEEDRQAICRLRHGIYASELGQHPENPTAFLNDKLDAFNEYIVARIGEEIAGFVSITPPHRNCYSLDKYLPRSEWLFPVDKDLYEIRLLTVVESCRRREVAALLMYGAFRCVESRGGTRLMAIGRQEIITLYLKAGLQRTGQVIQSGKVCYEVLHETVRTLRTQFQQPMLDRLFRHVDWQLDFDFHQPAHCFHGGTFFKAVGETFNTLERSGCIINADVLDAWFPPSPKAVAALQEYLPWLLRTSPPNDAMGLVQTIAEARAVAPRNILPGAGSSDLIFLAFLKWLTPSSRVLILDPIYSEYPHVLERVVGCQVERFPLSREDGYDVDLNRLQSRLKENFDLLVLVNPNSPTGRHIDKNALIDFLRAVPRNTRVWVDETYVEYAGTNQSVEHFAANSPNVVVCKSMSKVYALSGARVAYLCASAHLLEGLRAITPPWAVSLPAQVAAVHALQDPKYYAERYAQTHQFRQELEAKLATFGWEIIPSCANFLLAHLPSDGIASSTLVSKCQQQHLFLRNPSNMGTRFGEHAVRIAVKDAPINQRIFEIIRETLKSSL